ncbi:prolyl oligopeptidase family serine peptidase [Ferruginibacter paludis]|uniref:S9 family peptidase n=1 Tax=Ferruginibacter paludis TaxID=1310417 RepID=UPI0025B34E9E|nr:prolyl oligopeptidase family serine peptidase [Ferruginibacter paludis]MDN3657024.1 prolyl oligopeptidase family serine peptidase [Ferruginibacter paludis]
MKKIFLLVLLPVQLLAQTNPFAAFKAYNFPTELHAASSGSKIAWALDEQGKRNVYVAEGPAFKPRKLTSFSKDDGQEITSVSISADGKWVVFVRGGDHGANWDHGLPLNPSFETNPFHVQVASVPFDGGETKYLSEGDDPVISPDSKTVAFIKGGQAWAAPIDGSAAARNLFTTRGNVGLLEYSAGDSLLLFVAHRNDHSIIGIYTNGATPIKWIAPSFSFDETPHWSPDNKSIVFIRRPGAGGAPDSLLVQKHIPWSIYTADIASGKATLLWKAPATLRGSVPTTEGGYNLHWAANNRIIFLSYQDGWPHLYSIAADGGKETLLTPGNFMCEHITLSTDKKYLTFSANTGNGQLDIERRHAAKVSVDKADMHVLTNGSGLEWTPLLINDNNTLAFISATAQRPPLPAVMQLSKSDNAVQLMGEELIPTSFPKEKLIIPTQVIFKSADGVTVHADLFLPAGGTSKKPAIVYVHGGPPRQMLLGWHYSDYYSNAYASNQYLASLGFVVLSVNYRLGIGYGYEFHQAKNAGEAGASEYLDIKAAGEWLRKQTFVDAQKIGIYGGSYGGYLTAMALAKDSKLFAAGVDIHGVHDWASRSGLLTAYNEKYEKAPDLEKALKTAWYSSPIPYMKTWKSPVLIIHADDDRNVQFNESVDIINRLEKQHVTYETIMIADDTHHWMKWENAVTVYGAVAEFFVRKFK